MMSAYNNTSGSNFTLWSALSPEPSRTPQLAQSISDASFSSIAASSSSRLSSIVASHSSQGMSSSMSSSSSRLGCTPPSAVVGNSIFNIIRGSIRGKIGETVTRVRHHSVSRASRSPVSSDAHRSTSCITTIICGNAILTTDDYERLPEHHGSRVCSASSSSLSSTPLHSTTLSTLHTSASSILPSASTSSSVISPQSSSAIDSSNASSSASLSAQIGTSSVSSDTSMANLPPQSSSSTSSAPCQPPNSNAISSTESFSAAAAFLSSSSALSSQSSPAINALYTPASHTPYTATMIVGDTTLITTSYERVSNLEADTPVRSENGNPYQLMKVILFGTISYLNRAMYVGPIVNNMRHGLGLMGWPDGYFADDKMHGRGVLQYSNEVAFVCHWLHGKKHGPGTIFWRENVCNCTFDNNQIRGNMAINYANGMTYMGRILNGKRSGFGVLTWPNGGIYHGFFRNDVREGFGIDIQPSGIRYFGYWSNDKRQGRGVLIGPNLRHTGTWFNDQLDGYGSIFEPGVIRYSGGFRAGLFHGIGSATCFNYGNAGGQWVYTGAWQNGQWHGYGRLWKQEVSENGTVRTYYEGNFLNGLMHGMGTLTTARGSIRSNWHQDVPASISEIIDNSGNTHRMNLNQSPHFNAWRGLNRDHPNISEQGSPQLATQNTPHVPVNNSAPSPDASQNNANFDIPYDHSLQEALQRDIARQIERERKEADERRQIEYENYRRHLREQQRLQPVLSEQDAILVGSLIGACCTIM